MLESQKNIKNIEEESEISDSKEINIIILIMLI